MVRSSGTVLLLNYNGDERASFRQALINAGFDVIVCIDPLDALRVAASRRPVAVVTRMHHPNSAIDGVEFIQRLKADSRAAAARVVVTLSLQEAVHTAAAMNAGADECLLLPSSADEVAGAVTEAVNRELAYHSRSA